MKYESDKLIERIGRIAGRNFRSALISFPILGFLLVLAHDYGDEPGAERLICAAMGFDLGWGIGMAALYWVVKPRRQPRHGDYYP